MYAQEISAGQETSYEYSSTTVTYNSDENVVRSSSQHYQSSQSGTQTLVLTAVGAQTDKDVETLGKQDPFLQFSLNHEDKKSFQKTFTAKKAGKTPAWNQTFTLALAGEKFLYVELLDEESVGSELIGFAAIPIAQVIQAPGAALNGAFDLYNVKGNTIGTLNLKLQGQGFPNSSNQEVAGAPVRGMSLVDEAHQKRCKSMKTKEHAGEAGVALLGGALAVGAGLLGKKMYDDHKKEEEQKRNEQEEEDRRRQEFSQREEELKHREEEFSRREQQDKEDRERRQREENDRSSRHHEERREEHHREEHHREERHHHERRDACEWDPVGTYAAGDRVEYHGRTYVCLQGHTSNPTWEPTVAPSLWRTA
ncbi:hypothetical protein DM01DRAFT_1339379 [Hesseltinella vesiculosa]|uniref:C2 domain-containing protein n=1 Tax=Hesseltinella vesiculosa TaxID=101127 RepID=A0A1X2G6Y1_9FUNG|nr:hypothetical protein DM01DRAFT_1339379 [Hesseltinella vesiculosa]